MIQVESAGNESIKSESGVPPQQHSVQTPIERFLQKLSRLELPTKEHFESYLRHKWRLNHKRSRLQGSFASVRLFLEFCGKSGKRDLNEMERADLEAFIEHLQDGGLKISTVKEGTFFPSELRNYTGSPAASLTWRVEMNARLSGIRTFSDRFTSWRRVIR